MIDLLVVSQSCLTGANRAPYRLLRERGFQVELAVPAQLTSSGFARRADPPRVDDPPLHFFDILGTHPRLWHYRGLLSLLTKRRPRIVLLDSDPGSVVSLEVGTWARLSGARVSCISCDNMPRTFASELRFGASAGVRLLAARGLGQLSRSLVDHVFALSTDIAEVVSGVGFEDRVSVMPLGFDPSVFFPDERAREAVRKELGLTAVTVAYFGRLIPEKGVHLLLQSLARIARRPWHLLLDRFAEYRHPYATKLRDSAEHLGIVDRIVEFDADHTEIARYMNAADIVVVPSVSNPRWKEQYGRVAPEAMACGRTVVVSTCGALPELVGNAGAVVAENDVPALTAAITQLMDDPGQRERYGALAVRRATGQLSIKRQCDVMQAVFDNWVGRPRLATEQR